MSSKYGIVCTLVITFFAIGCNEKNNKTELQQGEIEKEINARINVKGIDPASKNKCSHDADKSICFICDPKKRDPSRLWCKEHNRYEDRCFLCHPEIRDSTRLFCEEHGLYEDECFICHPEINQSNLQTDISGQTLAKVDKSDKSKELFCKEHNVPESECGICHPELLSGSQTGKGMKVRFSSSKSVAKAGVETGKLENKSMGSSPSFLSRVIYNQNKFALITSLAPGVIQKVYIDFGQEVKEGQILAEVSSLQIAQAKAEYLTNLSELKVKEAVHNREKVLMEKGASSKQEFEVAEALYQKTQNETAMARQKLVNFGFTEREVSTLVKERTTSSSLFVRAPFSGIITNRNAVIGESVEPGASLFSLADLSTMWLEISIPLEASEGIHIGDKLLAEFDGLMEMHFPADIIWVSSSIDPNSRFLNARALIKNPNKVLRDGLYGRAVFISQEKREGLVLPEEAIQRIDGKDYVFVKIEEDLYEIRKVWLEEGIEGNTIVREGISFDDEIVLAGSFTMKSEFLKSRLGAGCVDE